MGDVVSVAIGEANLRISVANAESQKLALVYKAPTQKTNAKLMAQIFKQVDKVKDFEGIGIASPGLLHAGMGIIRKSRNLGLKELKIVELLEKRYKVPVFLTSRAIAGVMGEHLFGGGKNVHNMAFLTFSTGIECGIILNNRLLLGKEGNAHEIGHATIDATTDVKCGCGGVGHWEAFTSGSGIPVFAKYLLATKYAGQKSTLSKVKDLKAADVFDMAKKDVVAQDIVHEIGRLNAVGAGNMASIFDLELIFVGGGVALSNKGEVIDPIARNIGKYTVNSPPKVMVSPLGEKAVPYGAVADFM